MRVLCYDCWLEDLDIRETIWLNSEWCCALPAGGIRFYIREDRISLVLLLGGRDLYYKRPLDYYL
jgi:hypothetical protein